MAIITISRGTFSGGKEIAERVAEKLGYKCISREVLLEAAKDFHVPLGKMIKALKKKPGIFEKMTREKQHYLVFITDELIKAVRNENAVYHGLAGHLLLKKVPHVIRVKVVANMEYRIKTAMDRYRFSRKKAINYIAKVDHERNNWVKAIYHVERNDLHTYDIVINLDKIKMDTAVNLVVSLAKREEFKATEESRKLMNEMILVTDVRANIAADGRVMDGKLEIDSKDGIVTIGGKADSLVEADRIRKIVLNTKGVKDVVSNMVILGNR
ncbi:MAG: cytidylate kinase family protein [bacterium]